MVEQNSLESLHDIIQHCMDQRSAQREAAWREFLSRYKMYIYGCVTKRCLSWRVTRLDRQLSDVVNDIVSEVMMILTKSLGQYREVDYEPRFRLWLATVCNRAAGRYLRREFYNEVADEDLEEFRNYIQDLEFENRWELYENVVQQIRGSVSAQKQHLERDINLFMFYTWSDFSQPMIQAHPCYNELGHRVIDNVVNRIRTEIRQKKTVA